MPQAPKRSPRKKVPAKKSLSLHDYLFPHKGNKYKPHIFRTASLVVIVLVLVALEAMYVFQVNVVFPKTNFLGAVLPAALVSLTNSDRAASDLAPVTENSTLDEAAQNVANNMASEGYFAHVSPSGQSPWYWLNQVGYSYQFAGENLAVNFTDSEQVESAWMQSPTHKANIEKPQYTEVGIGVANGMYQGKEATFVVEYFASPAPTGTAAPPQSEEPPVQEAAPSAVPTPTGTGEIALAPTTQSVPNTQTAPPAPTQAETQALAAQKIASQSLTPSQVLGASTSNANALAAVAPNLPQAPTDPLAFAAQVITSPTQTILYIFGTLALIVLALLLIEFAVKARMKYLEMTGGGLALLTVLLGLMIFNFIAAPHVLVSNELQPVQTTSGT